MTSKTRIRATFFFISVLLSSVLLLSSCGLGKNRTISPREAPGLATVEELKTLQQENEELMARQDQARESIEALTREIEEEKAEHKRFREMMATNFDLLEQSVALSLSKSIARQPIMQPNPKPKQLGSPAKKALPPNRAIQRPRAVPPAAAAGAMAVGGKIRGGAPPGMERSESSPTPRHAAGASSTSRVLSPAPSGKAKPRALAVRLEMATDPGDGRQLRTPLDDSDLIPPSNPRRLTSHRKAKALYDKGFGHFARGEYDRAVLVYEDFLVQFPKDFYSDNAQFWIGESYFRQGRFADAESAYREVLRNYEHRSSLEGFKTPESIYRIGQTYLKRNEPRSARFYFSAAAEKFPDTSAGRKAQRELESLLVKTAETQGSLRSGRGS